MRKQLGLIVCDQCGYEFPASAVNIKTSDQLIGGIKLRVVYFRCPSCNKAYLIQIVDDKCAVLQQEFLKQKARWQANVGRNNDTEVVSGQYVSMVAKQKRLADRIEMLKQRYGNEIGVYLDRTTTN